MTNLVQDTVSGRLRIVLARSLHAVDDAVWRAVRSRVRILFEAASPLSLAVFTPVLRRLERDPRLELWFTASDREWAAEGIFGSASIRTRVISPSRARWMKFDGYINTDFWNMTWLPRRARRIHMFHGVAGKYGLDAPVRIAPVVASFDRLFFPNRDRLERYAAAGLTDSRGPRAALIGFPKADCLVDGSFDRAAIQRELGLEPSRPTVLYAPTWSPYSSLNLMGDAIVDALSRLDVNVVVKLHDRSYDGTERGSGGVDWKRRIEEWRRKPAGRRVRVVTNPDVSPSLFAADLLVTDHSSVGFEFMLLDRPIIVVDCPELIQKARISSDKVGLLRSAADVVADSDAIGPAVQRALDSPQVHCADRRRIARDLFHDPGRATARAVQSIYDLLELEAPQEIAMDQIVLSPGRALDSVPVAGKDGIAVPKH